MRSLKYEFLEWAVGIFCLAIGTMMLTVPHQYNTPSYDMLRNALGVWGILFFLTGGLMLTVAIFKPRYELVVLAHLSTGILLLLLAVGFAQAKALSGITHYTVLGLGTLLAPFVANRSPQQPHTSDLFGVAMSAAAIVTGATIFFFPGQYNPSIIAVIGAYLPGMGAAFLIAGLFAFIAILYPHTPSILYKLALITLGFVYFLWFVQLAVPLRALTGYPYYGGMGMLLMLMPWLQDRVYRLQGDSLRVRFALVLALLTAIPLLVLAVLFTEQQGDSATDQALSYQQNFAVAQSEYIASLVDDYRSAAIAFAAQPGLMQMSQEEQEQLAKALKQAYPAVLTFALRDASNNLLARSDGIRQVKKLDPDPLYEKVRSTRQPALRIGYGSVYQRFLVVFAAPVLDQSDQLIGLALVTVDTARFSDLLSRTSAKSEDLVYLVDEQGQIIVHPDTNLIQTSADLSQIPPVAKLLSREAKSGSLAYLPAKDNAILAGYARVPGVDWGVVVERSATYSLTGVQTGREFSLLLLILVSGVALLMSTLISRSLSDPLSKVSYAINQLATGVSQTAPLSSGIAEIKLLINSFNDLRERLARRTEERDKADKRLMFLVEATNALNASLDVEETLQAIAKMAVPALADWCTIDIIGENNVLQQVTVVHTDPKTEALVTRWRAEELRKPHDVDLGRDVLRTGEPILIPEIPANMVDSVASGDEETVKLLKALNLLSALCVPLSVRGERIGVIFLNTSRESGRRLTNDDVVLIGELARRAGTAIDNAKLYAEAQSAIQLRDEFLSVAAHELKTPVTSLRGFAQTTLRQFEKNQNLDPERIQSALKRIDQQSERLGRLIVQLLDVSRIMGGKLAIEPKDVDLVALVKNVAMNAQLTTQRHTIQVSNGLECYATVDPLRFEQVLTNLVDNAIKYSPDGGPINIDVSMQSDNTSRITITDHGLGIPTALREQIFNRFFQAHKEGYYGGMGLGLYISRQIVELHGGTIQAEFPAEGGTRFVISLPTKSKNSLVTE